ncbi:MAG: hypothetical protein IPH07_14500 [Deltaproteobacteria bacterium]|nr:hypothetical protein [Deltaproteobacteria bacterium]MBK8717498.1 hypothetical protein [Deltaproteobacteria bacterium]MBP7289582.1 hypothetical protein [Nannocystaceae bacterium]
MIVRVRVAEALAAALRLHAPAEGDAEHGGAATLQWTAPAVCPDEAAVRSRVEQIIGRPLREGDEAVRVVARVTDDEPPQLQLSITSDSGSRERVIDGRDCAELAEVTAVLVAVAVDPSASPLPPASAPAPAPAPAPAATPSTAATPRPEPRAQRSTRVRPAASGGVAARPAATIHVAPGVGLGAVPGPTAVLAVGAGVRWLHARIDLAFEQWFARPATLGEGDAGVDVRAFRVGVRGCYVPTAGRVVELPLCAGLFGGAMRGDGRGVPRTNAQRIAWGGAQLEAGLMFAPLRDRRWFAVGPMLRLQAPFVRPAFSLDGLGVAHRTGVLGFVGAIQVELRFP